MNSVLRLAAVANSSHSVVQDLLKTVRENMQYLFAVSESLSHLDLMVSFANVVTLGTDYTKPDFTKTGPIAIKNGRHPVVEALNPDFVPNSTYLNIMANLQIITGPNNSVRSWHFRAQPQANWF